MHCTLYLLKACAVFLGSCCFFALSSLAEQRPYVFVFQKQQNPAQMRARADEFAAALAEKLGRDVRVVIPGDYSASVQALVSRTADIAYLDSMSFLLAQRDGDAELLLAEVRPDAQGVQRTEYDSVLVVRRDSEIRTLEDFLATTPSRSIAFTSRSSTSGYLFPYREFVKQDLMKPGARVEEIFQRVSYAGSYRLALLEVLQGRSDVAAVSVYTVEGAATDKYLSEAELGELRILGRISGVPTHVLAARAGLTDEQLAELREALLSTGSRSVELLQDVYGAASFAEVDAAKHVLASREALEFSGVSLSGRGR